MNCPSCGTAWSGRIDLLQHGPANSHVGGATDMRRMLVCSNVECNAVIAPYDKPVPAKPTVSMVEPIRLSPEELAEATGNVAILSGQAPPVAPPAPVTIPTADEILETITRRLAFVEAEIAKLRGYEAEREKLEQMLTATAPASGAREAG